LKNPRGSSVWPFDLFKLLAYGKDRQNSSFSVKSQRLLY
jgi:hypothetical protein